MPLILCVPLVAVLLLVRNRFVAHTLIQLAGQVLICWGVYGLELLWALRTGRLWQVQGLHDKGSPAEPVAAVIGTY